MADQNEDLYQAIREQLNRAADEQAADLIEEAGRLKNSRAHDFLYRALEQNCQKAAVAIVTKSMRPIDAIEALSVKLITPDLAIRAADVLQRLDPSSETMERYREQYLSELNDKSRLKRGEVSLTGRLVRAWVEARAHENDRVRSGIERLLKRCPDSRVREGVDYHLKGGGSGGYRARKNMVDRALETQAKTDRLRKLTDVLEPRQSTVARLAEHGHTELARQKFQQRSHNHPPLSEDSASFYREYGDDPIPSPLPEGGTARRLGILREVVSKRNAISTELYSVFLDTPEQLRAIFAEGDKQTARLVVRDLSRAIVRTEDQEAFIRYMPILLECTYSGVLEGGFDFNTTRGHEEAYALLECLLLWGRDRNRLDRDELVKAMGRQFNHSKEDDEWTADERIVDLLYNFGFCFPFSIETDSSQQALTTEVALTILRRDSLEEDQYTAVLTSILARQSQADARPILKKGFTPRSLAQYQEAIKQALRQRSPATPLLIYCWRQSSIPVKGLEVMRRALAVDLSTVDASEELGLEQSTTEALIEAEWRPEGHEQITTLFGLIFESDAKIDTKKTVGRAMVKADLVPPMEFMDQAREDSPELHSTLTELLSDRRRNYREISR